MGKRVIKYGFEEGRDSTRRQRWKWVYSKLNKQTKKHLCRQPCRRTDGQTFKDKHIWTDRQAHLIDGRLGRYTVRQVNPMTNKQTNR